MAVDPAKYEAIEGVDSDGFLKPDASPFEVGFAISELRDSMFEAKAADTLDEFMEKHGLDEEMRGPLGTLFRAGSLATTQANEQYPLPTHRPIEGKLAFSDLASDAADVIPVNPVIGHYIQTVTSRLLQGLADKGIVRLERGSDAHQEIFPAMIEAGEIGYRARVIEEAQ